MTSSSRVRRFQGFWPSTVYLATLALGLLAPAITQAFPVELSYAPDTDLALTVRAIESAKQSIHLNIYELTSPDIANALIDRVHAGVHVEILEEGRPVGGMSTVGKGIQSQIVQAMLASGNGDRFFEMIANGGKRRYTYDHAKYIVVDGQALLIGSENYSPSGNPTPGSVGNRGWEIFIHEPQISQKFLAMFQQDSNTSNSDITDLTHGGSGQYHPGSAAQPPIVSSTVVDATAWDAITSPDSSQSGLLELINQAQKSIDLQEMTFNSMWKNDTSPLLTAILQAAARGVQVRVLLNDDRVFAHAGKPFHSKNQDTVDFINHQAQQKRLPMSAHIANIKAMGVDYIHNKGMLIDGHITLISSINWDENSIQKNREAGVAIDSAQAYSFYDSIFSRDWSVSAGGTNQIIASAPQAMPVPAPEPVETTAFNCPSQVQLNVQVGSLNLRDSQDRAFKELSGKTISSTLTRAESGHGCLLVSAPRSSNIAESLYLELRPQANGAIFVIVEGYIGQTNRTFSIRTRTSPDRLQLPLNAEVYDGAGSKEDLGPARLGLKF
jgi:phosphatidylserine/phosphatidylglycerophosphate/cardiolipin synthase-like enzyme